MSKFGDGWSIGISMLAMISFCIRLTKNDEKRQEEFKRRSTYKLFNQAWFKKKLNQWNFHKVFDPNPHPGWWKKYYDLFVGEFCIQIIYLTKVDMDKKGIQKK